MLIQLHAFSYPNNIYSMRKCTSIDSRKKVFDLLLMDRGWDISWDLVKLGNYIKFSNLKRRIDCYDPFYLSTNQYKCFISPAESLLLYKLFSLQNTFTAVFNLILINSFKKVFFSISKCICFTITHLFC